jgi:hypothetical protein
MTVHNDYNKIPGPSLRLDKWTISDGESRDKDGNYYIKFLTFPTSTSVVKFLMRVHNEFRHIYINLIYLNISGGI